MAASIEKERANAEKKGVSTEGATVVLHDFRDGRDHFLLLFPDRVDIAHAAKLGSLLGSGQGVESYPLAEISSVQVEQKGIWSYLKITGPGFEESFVANVETGPYARNEILKARSTL